MSLRSLSVSGQVLCSPPTQMHKAGATPVGSGAWHPTPVPERAAPPQRLQTPQGALGREAGCRLCPTHQSGSQRSPGSGGPHVAEALLSSPPTPPEKKAKTVLRAHSPKQEGWLWPLGWLLHWPLLNERLL